MLGDSLEKVKNEVLVCTRCALHKSRSIAVPGEGSATAEIMLIGEGPGFEEDRQGRPFVGRAGQLLNEALISAGLKREDVYITNVVKCFISPKVLVYTAEGYKPISRIKVADMVLTHAGRFRRVTYIRPREALPAGSLLVRVTCKAKEGGGSQRPINLMVTPEHPFLVNREWKRAIDIRIGDRIAALGDLCEVCGKQYYVSYDRYDRRKFRTCSHRCHNIRIHRKTKAREKVRRSLLTLREPLVITQRAGERTPALVLSGLAKIQCLTSDERRPNGVVLAANARARRNKCPMGYGEPELRAILDRLGIQYVHHFPLPGTRLIYDFCLPQHNILIEVREPGFGNSGSNAGSILKYRVAKEHGYLLFELWGLQVIQQPDMVESILGRLMANHKGMYTFVELEVVNIEHYHSRRQHILYNIGVEDDESFIADGIVSHNCRPPGNRTPLPEERAACRPYLDRQIALISPKIICLLGATAVQELLGEPSVGRLRGKMIHRDGRLYFVTIHPAAALYNIGLKQVFFDDIKKLMEIWRGMKEEKEKETSLDKFFA